MEYPASLPARFVREGNRILDTEGLHKGTYDGMDPALIDYSIRCWNAADGIMKCTGSVSATHTEADPRDPNWNFVFYADRYEFSVSEARA